MLVGYVRALPILTAVSQRTALDRAACQKIYEEPDQPPSRFTERDRMLDHLWEGDVVVVMRLSCLADTLPALILVGQRLFDREAGLISRAEPWADSSRTDVTFLSILSGLALLELDPGPAPRPVAGQPSPLPRPGHDEPRVGRPAKITPAEWARYGPSILSGELSIPVAAKLLKCGRATLYRHVAQVRRNPSAGTAGGPTDGPGEMTAPARRP